MIYLFQRALPILTVVHVPGVARKLSCDIIPVSVSISCHLPCTPGVDTVGAPVRFFYRQWEEFSKKFPRVKIAKYRLHYLLKRQNKGGGKAQIHTVKERHSWEILALT